MEAGRRYCVQFETKQSTSVLGFFGGGGEGEGIGEEQLDFLKCL